MNHHKLKKQIIRARNRKNQLINQHAKQHEEEHQRRLDEEEEMRQAAKRANPDTEVDEVAWSAKMQEVRNKLTGRKRMAKERWNRFAATAAAGGKGL